MTKSETQIPAPSYRGPLIVVIILGVLNVLALGALIGGAVMSLNRASAVSRSYDTWLDLPAGAAVQDTQSDGTHLLIRHADRSGGQAVSVIDIRDGRVLGTVHLSAAPSSP
jgi:hypothetical protein